MTLANMRTPGVRSLWVVYELCHHEAALNSDRYGAAVPGVLFPNDTFAVSRNIHTLKVGLN